MPTLRFAAQAMLACLLTAGAVRAADYTEVRVESVRLLDQGISAYNRGDFPAAVESLRKSAGLALNSFRAHYYLGLALAADRRLNDAVDALEIALDLEPANVQALVAMGDARLGQGDPDEAAASFARALKLRSEFPAALDGIARVYESRGESDRAVEFFRRAIASNKGYAESYAHLGKLHLREGRLGEAVQLFREAVSIRTDFAFGYNGLAQAYSRLGLQSDALVAVAKAIELEPRSPDHQVALGNINLEAELLNRADAAFRKALELDPGFPDARLGLSETARRRGDYAAAVQELDSALTDDRMDSLTRERLLTRRAVLAREGEQAAKFEADLQSGSASPESLRGLAAILAGRREWARAAELLSGLDNLGIERERYAYYLLKAGRRRQAYDIYSGLAQNTPRADLEINAGVAMSGLGNDPEASAAYRRALALDPANVRAQLYLANSLVRMGRNGEAATIYRQFLAVRPDGAAAERVKKILDAIAPAATEAKP